MFSKRSVGRGRAFTVVASAVVALFAIAGVSYADADVLEVEIQVSPHVLNIAAYGEEVSVHTDIKYSLVDPESVTLSGVALSGYKADDCGYFVAKFEMRDLLGLDLVAGERYEFVLKGETVDGAAFAGDEEILIVSNRGAAGRKK
jgi:hypothetical protein